MNCCCITSTIHLYLHSKSITLLRIFKPIPSPGSKWIFLKCLNYAESFSWFFDPSNKRVENWGLLFGMQGQLKLSLKNKYVSYKHNHMCLWLCTAKFNHILGLCCVSRLKFKQTKLFDIHTKQTCNCCV